MKKTIIPQTIQGIEFANQYEERLKAQGFFNGRAEDTQSIVINAVYRFVISEEAESEDT